VTALREAPREISIRESALFQMKRAQPALGAKSPVAFGRWLWVKAQERSRYHVACRQPHRPRISGEPLDLAGIGDHQAISVNLDLATKSLSRGSCWLLGASTKGLGVLPMALPD